MKLRQFGRPISCAIAIAGAFFCTQAVAQSSDAPFGAQSADAAVAADANAEDDAVNKFATWIIASQDNHHAPFIVVDKTSAKVFVFDAESRLAGVTPALLGIARGDESAPGVGTQKLSAIAVHDRTTPAGRFAAHIGMATGNHEVLWVDYAAAISLHPVVTASKRERRIQRLNSPSAEDNRITFGCINVPASFYKNVVRPLFAPANGVVYILPETKSLAEVFEQLRPSEQASALPALQTLTPRP